MNRYFIIILTIGLSLGVFGQNNELKVTKISNQATAKETVKSEVIKQLKEVYGDAYKIYIKDQSDRVQFYTDFYLRCEYIPFKRSTLWNKKYFKFECYEQI